MAYISSSAKERVRVWGFGVGKAIFRKVEEMFGLAA